MQAIEVQCARCGRRIADDRWRLIPSEVAGDCYSDGPYHEPCHVAQLEDIARDGQKQRQNYAVACAEDRRHAAALDVARGTIRHLERARNSWIVVAVAALTVATASMLLAGWWNMRCGGL